MRYDHWSHSSREFKIFGIPAGPVILTFPMAFLISKGVSIMWLFLIAMWMFYIIFVGFFRLHPRHSWFLIRTWLTGKNKGAKNENSPLQY
ncbi:hypothetical protein ACFBZI_11525 [Moraxella sp. ZJ142]|uniref:hypothetical protein n=1 Tax=Moraxella marmotae TaxID=3344520 RepID=UPI0035D49848